MRRFKLIAFAWMIAAFVVSGCQKDFTLTDGIEPTGQTPQSGQKVKTYTENIAMFGNEHSEVYNLFYDSKERLTSMERKEDNRSKFQFSYPSDRQYQMDLIVEGVTEIRVNAFFNAGMLLDSMTQMNLLESNKMYEKYEYNSSNQLVRVMEYAYDNDKPVLDNITDYSYNSAGDCIKIEDRNGVTTEFEYGTDEVLYPQILPILGKVKKEKVVKKKNTKMGSSIVEESSYSYTYDAQKRISTIKAMSNAGVTVTRSYTYY